MGQLKLGFVFCLIATAMGQQCGRPTDDPLGLGTLGPMNNNMTMNGTVNGQYGMNVLPLYSNQYQGSPMTMNQYGLTSGQNNMNQNNGYPAPQSQYQNSPLNEPQTQYNNNQNNGYGMSQNQHGAPNNQYQNGPMNQQQNQYGSSNSYQNRPMNTYGSSNGQYQGGPMNQQQGQYGGQQNSGYGVNQNQNQYGSANSYQSQPQSQYGGYQGSMMNQNGGYGGAQNQQSGYGNQGYSTGSGHRYGGSSYSGNRQTSNYVVNAPDAPDPPANDDFLMAIQALYNLRQPSSARYKRDLAPEARLIGGTQVNGQTGSQLCWQVLLRRQSSFISASGAIVGRRTIVTAASAVQGLDGTLRPEELTVFTGVLRDTDFPQQPILVEGCGQSRSVATITIHPEFNNQGAGGINDVAIITLTEDIDLTQSCACSLCLRPREPSVGERCSIAGFSSSPGATAGIPGPLTWATLPILAPTDCGQVDGSGLCLGVPGDDTLAGGVAACDGDRGGPIVCFDTTDSSYYVAGILTRFDSVACTGGVVSHTKLAPLVSWILQNSNNDL